ncbi:hypothetical protein CLOM_g20201 [Closterium sp. NIES-68]|nr:hypothetical protein CLOM_g20201 [Closterium sp. NIES-68]GJP77298.1 hypothetical protein CLOP_g7715 [Closterium sp. NIES-67]
MTVERSRSSDDSTPPVLGSPPLLHDENLPEPLFILQLEAEDHLKAYESLRGAILSPSQDSLGERSRRKGSFPQVDGGITMPRFEDAYRGNHLPQSPLSGSHLPQSPRGGKPRRRHAGSPVPRHRPDLLRGDSPPAGSPLSRAVHAHSPLGRARIASPRALSPRKHGVSAGSPRATVPFKAAHHHHARNARPAHVLRLPDNPLLAEIFSPHSSAGPRARGCAESSRASVTPRDTARPLPDDFTAARIPGGAPPSLAAEIPPTFWELPPEQQQQGRGELPPRGAAEGAGVLRRWRSFGRRSVGNGSSRLQSGCHVDVETNGDTTVDTSGASAKTSGAGGGSGGREVPRSRLDLAQPFRMVRSFSARLERVEPKPDPELWSGGLDSEGSQSAGKAFVETQGVGRRGVRGTTKAKSEPLKPKHRMRGCGREGLWGQGGADGGYGGVAEGCAGPRGEHACGEDGIGRAGHGGADGADGFGAVHASAAEVGREIGYAAKLDAAVGGEEEEEVHLSRPSVLSVISAALQGRGRSRKEETPRRIVRLNSLSSVLPGKSTYIPL